MLFKMVATQTKYIILKQISVIEFLVAKKCKLCKIYGKMCGAYGEGGFSKKRCLQMG